MKVGLLILYGVLAAALVLTLLYFIYPPVTTFLQNAYASVAGYLGGLNLNLGGLDIGKLVTENIGAIATVGVTGVTALITMWKLRSQVKLNEQLVEQQKNLVFNNTNLQSTVSGLNQTVSNQEQVIQRYATDTTSIELQKRLDEMKMRYEPEIESYKRQIADLMTMLENRPTQVVTEVK